MKHIVVIQLGRLGDILQTTPLLAALRSKHPRAIIDVPVMIGNRDLLESSPYVDRVIPVDNHLEGDTLTDSSLLWDERRVRLVSHLRDEIGGQPDWIINCTHNEFSSALTYALGSMPRIDGTHQDPRVRIDGNTLDTEGNFLIHGDWMRTMVAFSSHPGCSSFNIVDIYVCVAGVASPLRRPHFEVKVEERVAAESLLRSNGINEGQRLIAMQPGASKSAKCRPPELFGRLGARLETEAGARILLIGSPEERELTEKVASYMSSSALNLAGQTSIGLLAALLEQCDCAITNDSGPLHLAAAVAVPTVALFSDRTHVRDTGAYGAGHIAIQGGELGVDEILPLVLGSLEGAGVKGPGKKIPPARAAFRLRAVERDRAADRPGPHDKGGLEPGSSLQSQGMGDMEGKGATQEKGDIEGKGAAQEKGKIERKGHARVKSDPVQAGLPVYISAFQGEILDTLPYFLSAPDVRSLAVLGMRACFLELNEPTRGGMGPELLPDYMRKDYCLEDRAEVDSRLGVLVFEAAELEKRARLAREEAKSLARSAAASEGKGHVAEAARAGKIQDSLAHLALLANGHLGPVVEDLLLRLRMITVDDAEVLYRQHAEALARSAEAGAFLVRYFSKVRERLVG